MGAYAWKPSIIWEVLNEYKCQVVWLDTGNLINNKFKFVRIVLSNIGFFSPIMQVILRTTPTRAH